MNGLLSDFFDVLRLLRARIDFARAAGGAPASGAMSPGQGRVDVLRIASLLASGPKPLRGSAPVAAPQLWNSQTLPRIHWDQNTNSIFEHGMAQAIGLGAAVHPQSRASSLQPRNLHEMAEVIPKLRPPRWPFQPAPDPRLVASGQAVFARHCARCHQPDDGKFAVDPAVATDGARLAAYRQRVGDHPLHEVVAQALGGLKTQAYTRAGVAPWEQARIEAGRAPAQWYPSEGYAPRSLVGVWATAPYLHNDSVPSLADLLELDFESDRPRPRPARFSVKPGAYDVRRVGVELLPAAGPVPFDARQPGNGNGGHRYGTELTRPDKIELLEYLKSL